MCSLVSGVSHLWQFTCSGRNNFLISNVPLDPSHPILILNIYLISFILCLFNLMYFYAVTLYFLYPSSQNSFNVGNSLSICVRVCACLTMSLFILVLTIFIIISSYYYIIQQLIRTQLHSST